MQQLRVALLGAGAITQMMHLPYLKERPDLFEVTALCDRDRPRLEVVARRFGIEHTFGEAEELLVQPFDAVLITTDGCHAQLVEQALAAGKHVFVEKPLAESLAAADRLKPPELVLQVGYHKRFDPGYLWARQWISQRTCDYARVEILHPPDEAGREHHALTGPAAPPPERGDKARRRLFGSLVHDLNALRGWFGEPQRVLSAFADERMIEVALEFGAGLRAHLVWLSQPQARRYHEEFMVCTPGERLKLTFPSPYLAHVPAGVEVETAVAITAVQLPAEEAFRSQLHHFRACIRGEAPACNTFEEALADTRLMEEIYAKF